MSLFVSTEVMLQSGQKATVYYLSEEGKRILEDLVVSDKYTQTRIDTIFERFNKIEDELVRAVFLPTMQVHIVDSLRHGPKTQQEVMKPLPDWIKNHLLYRAFYMAWEAFEKSGVIYPISHGRGHARTWELSLLKKEVEAK